MKRLFVVVMSLVLFAGTALPTLAQKHGRSYSRQVHSSRYENSRTYYDRRYDNYRRSSYNRRGDRSYRYRNRNFWERNRDVLTVATGTGAGAVIGGIAGGNRGAVIGALVGAGGSALYTYGLRDRDNRRNRRR